MHFSDSTHFDAKACRCGTIHLSLGPTTIHLSADAAEDLSRLLQIAAHRLPLLREDRPRNEGVKLEVLSFDPSGNMIRGVLSPRI